MKLFVVTLVFAAWIQGQARAQFEVASVKRNNSGDTERYIRPSPGRLSIRNMNVRSLLKTAYGLMDFQVSGGPNWVDSESFDIEATANPDATPKQMAEPMLQSLLEQRFKLRVHQVTREFPVYILTASTRGPNLQPSDEQICVPLDPTSPLFPASPTRNPKELCGSIGLGLTSLNARQVTVAALTMAFSHLLGRTVIDKTNLAGEWDARLTFAPPGSIPSGAVIDPSLPDISVAVREQLGLKLESGNGPVEVLVIDQVEPPSEN